MNGEAPNAGKDTGPVAMRVVLAGSAFPGTGGLSPLLDWLDERATVWTAQDATALARALRDAEAPDLVILTPPFAAAAVRDAAVLSRDSFIVMVADFGGSDEVRTLLATGVRGCIPADSTPAVMRLAIQLVLAGGSYIPPIVLESGRARAGAGHARGIATLTPRQQEVLRHVSSGLSNRQIAAELGVTEGTVKLHVHAILKALGVSNRTEAALMAMDAGLVSLPSRRRS